jgi:arabinoxylan arabinofuranohydrolase
VTSEGFHIFGLDPYQYYSAGIACYLSNQQSVQDSWDIWDNSMPLANVQNGNVIGYKYFGFAGLDKGTKGLNAFAGARPGNKTAFNLFLAPKTTNAFKVNVWLNGPWDNATWNGKKLGEINVPANAAREVAKFTLDVASAVENLKEKHALFLVAEGPAGGPLCDIVGLGFSSDKVKIARPVPPAVSIKVNGQAIDLPVNPVRSSNPNGIIGYDIYDASYAVAADAAGIPQVTASSSDGTVKVEVKHAEAKNGTAFVKFDNHGVVKTYRVAFASK